MKFNKRLFILLLLSSTIVNGCGASVLEEIQGTEKLEDISHLSDDFTSAESLSNWTELSTIEGNESFVETVNVNETYEGELYLVPYSSGWWEDWRSAFFFKEVSGDFDVSTRINVKGKVTDVPVEWFSLSGLMARAPRDVTMDTWEAGKENWLFITTGYGDQRLGETTPQIETKTTMNSKSDLKLIKSQTGWVELRIVRIKENFYMLYKFENGSWRLSRSFNRPDLPETLQIGLIAYSNRDEFNLGPKEYMMSKEKVSGDLIVRSDYIHFERPHLAKELEAKIEDGSFTSNDLVEVLNSNP